MAHQRIRPFNTKKSYPEQNLDNDVAHAVVARGRTVYMRGQTPQHIETGKDIEAMDPVSQTHKVMGNIMQILEEAGGQREHIAKLVIYITDVRYREAVYRTMGEYIQGIHPVCTGIVVAGLARPEWVVEIDATAVIPD